MHRVIIFLLAYLVYSASVAASSTPPPANEVFLLSTRIENANTAILSLHTKPGYFLYQNRLHITLPETNKFEVKDIRLPESEIKINPLGHTFKIYHKNLNIPITIKSKKPGTALLNITFQGCSDNGFCYPPQKQTISLTLNDKLQLSNSQVIAPIKAQIPQKLTAPVQKPGLENLFFQNHQVTVLLIFFGLGLLLSFTPCVLPMIPVLSSIIVGQGTDVTTRKAFIVSLTYVLSMALTYSLVGALVASVGSNLQLIMQSNLVIALFSLVFTLLGISMLGFFELKFPTIWQSKLANMQRKQRSGHYLGAAIMGCLSILILSPCATPPLIGTLSYIAQTGKVVFGSVTLFFLGLGMGVPLLIIGTSAGRFLPRSGQWMNQVKSFFGFLLLAVAIYVSSRILPGFVILILWASLLIFSGTYYALAFQPRIHKGKRVIQVGGVLVFTYGFIILIGVAIGSNDPIHPLTNLAYHQSPALPVKNFQVVYNQSELNEAIQHAKGKLIFIDFYADWCASCRSMDKGVLKNVNILNALRNFVVIKADVTRLGMPQKKMLKSFDIIAPPTFVFIDRNGKELKNHRLIGEQREKSLSHHLHKIKKLDVKIYA